MPLSAVELAARRLIKNSNQEIIVMMKNSDGNWNISGDSHNMRTMTSTYGDEPSIYQNIKQDLEANVLPANTLLSYVKSETLVFPRASVKIGGDKWGARVAAPYLSSLLSILGFVGKNGRNLKDKRPQIALFGYTLEQ